MVELGSSYYHPTFSTASEGASDQFASFGGANRSRSNTGDSMSSSDNSSKGIGRRRSHRPRGCRGGRKNRRNKENQRLVAARLEESRKVMQGVLTGPSTGAWGMRSQPSAQPVSNSWFSSSTESLSDTSAFGRLPAVPQFHDSRDDVSAHSAPAQTIDTVHRRAMFSRAGAEKSILPPLPTMVPEQPIAFLGPNPYALNPSTAKFSLTQSPVPHLTESLETSSNSSTSSQEERHDSYEWQTQVISDSGSHS